MKLYCKDCATAQGLREPDSISEAFDEISELNYTLIDKFYEFHCAIGFASKYLPLTLKDIPTQFNEDLDQYGKEVRAPFQNLQGKKIKDLVKVKSYLTKSIKNIDKNMRKVGKHTIASISEEMVKDVDKGTYQSKLCLEDENKEFLENLSKNAVKTLFNEMDNKREQNKSLNNHTPYCYDYHTQFFKEECKGVEFKCKDTQRN